MNKNRGFSLIGTLVGAVVFTMVLGGSSKFVEITLQASNASKAVLTENDFKQTIAQGLISEGCGASASLIPGQLEADSTIQDSNPANGIGKLKDDFSLGGIKKGEDFKGSITVVKMELRGVATNETRDFVVYYKMKGLGKLNARDPLKCTNTDVTGCFEHSCTVEYKNNKCTRSRECHNFAGGGGGGGPPPCYEVDDSGKTLVGCGGTKDAGGTNTTAIGHDAGKDLTGGSDNIAIGHSVQLDSDTGSNQINIGNIIKAKPGSLKVCDQNGDCIKLKNFKCPDRHYFRGFYQENKTVNGEEKKKGDPICQPERCIPQNEEPNAYFWIPENKCHNCPRASPYYMPYDRPDNRCRNCLYGPSSYDLETNTCHNCYYPTNYYHSGKCNHCPLGDIYYWNGSICVTCDYGKANKIEKKCECPSSRPILENNLCVACTGGRSLINNVCQCTGARSVWDEYNKQCRCPDHRNWNSSTSTCVAPCTGGRWWVKERNECDCINSHWDGSNCICTGGRVWNSDRSRCVCPDATPYHYDGKCNKCQRNRHEYTHPLYGDSVNAPAYGSNRGCHTCPEATPYFYRRESQLCHVCPRTEYDPVYGVQYQSSGSTCTCGPFYYKKDSTKPWKCFRRCRRKSYWDGSKCQLRCKSAEGKGWRYDIKQCVVCSEYGNRKAYLGVCSCWCHHIFETEQDRCSTHPRCSSGQCYGQTSRTCKPGCNPDTQSWQRNREECVPKEIWPQDSL